MKGATLPIKRLSVTPQNCMSLYPSFSITEKISVKAAEILKSSDAIPAPGAPAGKFNVAKFSFPNGTVIVIIKSNFKM